MKPTILVVEDDPAIAQMINFHLDQARFQCKFAKDAAEARQHLCEAEISLILMDWMLPGDTTGVELTRELKQGQATRELPIIMLPARVDEKDKVCEFESGAEDYVTKPFSARELFPRIRALLSRTPPHAVDDIVEADDLLMEIVDNADRSKPVAHVIHLVMVAARERLSDQITALRPKSTKNQIASQCIFNTIVYGSKFYT